MTRASFEQLIKLKDLTGKDHIGISDQEASSLIRDLTINKQLDIIYNKDIKDALHSVYNNLAIITHEYYIKMSDSNPTVAEKAKKRFELFTEVVDVLEADIKASVKK